VNGRWVAVASVAVLVAGCMAAANVPPTSSAIVGGSSSPDELQPSQADAIIPWSSETPAPFPTPMPTPVLDAPTCRVGQLVGGDAGWEGATGSLLGGFLIWNTSGEPCRLEGGPSVKIVDAAGRPIDVTAVADSSPSARPIVLRARQPVPVLFEEAPIGLASVRLQWFNWCGPAPKEPLRLLATLPGGGVLRVPVVFGGGTPRCDASTAPSMLSVAPFEETPGPSPTDPPAVPAESLRLVLELPDHAVAGQTLHYVAILTNPTAAPVVLNPCPVYQERLNAEGGSVIREYVLACATMPVIAPGASARFAMDLDVPSSLKSDGGAAIVWSLDPYHSLGFPPRSPAQKVPIRIVAP
jgi:hypothetical protein